MENFLNLQSAASRSGRLLGTSETAPRFAQAGPVSDDLEPELAAKTRPYMHTRQEKLTGLQAAFFNLQMDRLNITDTKGLADKAEVIKGAGERHGVWSPGWSPRGTKHLQAYIIERIKTTLKRRRSELVVEQEKKKIKPKFLVFERLKP